jgi:hypothetical protein
MVEHAEELKLLKTEAERKPRLDETPRVIADAEDKDTNELFSPKEEHHISKLLENLQAYMGINSSFCLHDFACC